MSHEDFGPYERIRELGTGATASVWLARVARPVRNLEIGRDVAVKVLHEHWEPGSSVHERFLREAEVGRLVLHPNVVRVLDAGVADLEGRPRSYLAMEVAEGQTLRQLLEEGGRQPEALCRHIGREVALGLAAIHRAGMVHRDVKPENVMLASDGRVKVMDLGVAQLRDAAARMTQSGDFFGSPLYAAPEQVAPRRPTLDGRTDLYALGWVLYELASGSHPLDGLDMGALLHAQLHQKPPPLGAVRPDTTPFLEAVARSLLEKDVAARPADGETLARILEEGEQSTWWQAWQRSRREAGETTTRRVKRKGETAVHGRAGELGRLQHAWTEARDGDGGAVVLRGEAGVGKTRLLEELLDRIEEDHPRTTLLHGLYASSGVATLGSAIRDAFRDHLGAEGLEATLRDLLPDTPQLADPLAAYLRGERRTDTGPSLTPEALATAFLRVAQALAAREPTVVVIEDLHFAPQEDLALFRALARGAPGHRLLLLGATRPDVESAWLEAFAATPRCTLEEVTRLAEDHVASLLAERLRSDHAATELAPFLIRASDGNPFFLLELLRSMEQQGVLLAKPDGRWTVVGDPASLTVPEAVRIQIEARLARLSPEERATVDAAAMCGTRFDPGIVARLLGEPTIDVLRRLARLEREHGLVHPRGSDMVFDHAQVQETLVEALPGPLRVEYHRLLAELLLEDGEVTGEAAVEVCGHLLEAEEGPGALAHLDDALDYLEGAARHALLASLVERVLGVQGLAEGETRVRLLLRQVACLDVLGKKTELRRALDEALELGNALGKPGLHARTLIEHGKDLQRTGRADEAIPALTRAVSLAAAAGDRHAESEAHGARGVAHELSGRFEEAEADQRRRLEIAWDLGDRGIEARARGNLAQILFLRGDHGLAMEQFQECRRLFAEVGDELGEARATANLGLALQHAGRNEEANEQYARALQVYRRVGYRRGEANFHGNLALHAQQTGRLAEAFEHAHHALELQREVGNARDLAIALNALASLYWTVGLAEEARLHTEEALRTAVESGYRLGQGEALARLGELTRTAGELEPGERLGDEALAIFEEVGALHHLNAERLRRARRPGSEGRTALRELWAVAGDAIPETARLDAGFTLAERGELDAATVLGRYAEVRDDLDVGTRMTLDLRCWRLAEDPVHLRAARDGLAWLLEHAPDGPIRSALLREAGCRALLDALREAGEPFETPIG